MENMSALDARSPSEFLRDLGERCGNHSPLIVQLFGTLRVRARAERSLPRVNATETVQQCWSPEEYEWHNIQLHVVSASDVRASQRGSRDGLLLPTPILLARLPSLYNDGPIRQSQICSRVLPASKRTSLARITWPKPSMNTGASLDYVSWLETRARALQAP